ncbi:MAG: methylamine utilization protein [Oleiphilus sp.]|nr:MAG: methylamine utilization protein [Oleiphilus sp.]
MILRSIAVLTALYLFNGASWADVFKVVDENGKPLENAVVSVSTEVPAPELPTENNIAIMDQVGRAFVPHVLVVRKNQKVKFPNSDNIRHHVYSFSQPNDFEIKLYSGEPNNPVTFEHPGIVVLGCNIHDRMKGYIYVLDQQRASISNHEGIAMLETGPAEQVSVWHSRLKSGSSNRETVQLDKRDEQGNWLLQISVTSTKVRPKSKFRERYR